MKMQIDVKSAVLGLLVGAAAMLTMGDATQQNQIGRYQIAGTSNLIAVVDTQNGEVWGHFSTTEGSNGKENKFWDAKNQ